MSNVYLQIMRGIPDVRGVIFVSQLVKACLIDLAHYGRQPREESAGIIMRTLVDIRVDIEERLLQSTIHLGVQQGHTLCFAKMLELLG